MGKKPYRRRVPGKVIEAYNRHQRDEIVALLHGYGRIARPAATLDECVWAMTGRTPTQRSRETTKGRLLELMREGKVIAGSWTSPDTGAREEIYCLPTML